MDTDRFDAITRSSTGSRRAALGSLGALALTAFGINYAEGKKQKKTCPPGTTPLVRKKGKGKKKKVSVICVDDVKPQTVDCSQKECGDPDGKGGYCLNGTCPAGKVCTQVSDDGMAACHCQDLVFQCPVNSCETFKDRCGASQHCNTCSRGSMCDGVRSICCVLPGLSCSHDNDCCGVEDGMSCRNGVCAL